MRIAITIVAAAAFLMISSTVSITNDDWTSEPFPARDDAMSVLSTVTSAGGSTWAFGGWHPVPGQPAFRSQAYLRTGEGWQEIPAPDIGLVSDSAALSPDDVWAIGQEAKYGEGATMHWDGRRWTVFTLAPPPEDHRQYIFGLAALAADDVWAVGRLSSDDPSIEGRGVVQHWDGERWTSVPVPDVAGTWSLSSIGGVASDNLWAVGNSEAEPGQGVTLHWDGDRWSEVPAPEFDGSATQDALLHDVAALASDDVWASGTLYSYGDEESHPLMFHWDGKAWTVPDIPIEVSELGNLVRVGDQLWSLGSELLLYDGATWQLVEVPTGAPPTAATGIGDGRVLFVGSAGPGNEQHPVVSIYED